MEYPWGLFSKRGLCSPFTAAVRSGKRFIQWLSRNAEAQLRVHSLQVTIKTNLLAELKHQRFHLTQQRTSTAEAGQQLRRNTTRAHTIFQPQFFAALKYRVYTHWIGETRLEWLAFSGRMVRNVILAASLRVSFSNIERDPKRTISLI